MVHPLVSFTIILYVPPERLPKVPDDWNVSPLSIEYRSVPVPPDALIAITPSGGGVKQLGSTVTILLITISGFSATVTLPFISFVQGVTAFVALTVYVPVVNPGQLRPPPVPGITAPLITAFL